MKSIQKTKIQQSQQKMEGLASSHFQAHAKQTKASLVSFNSEIGEKTDVERSWPKFASKVDIINGNTWHMFTQILQRVESSHHLKNNEDGSQGQKEMSMVYKGSPT